MKLRHYLTLGISVAILLAWVLFLAIPAGHKENEIKSNIGDAQAKLTDFNRIMSTLPDFYDSRDALDARKSRLLSKLIPKKDVMTLFDRIKAMARQSNVTVKEITPSVEELLFLNRQMPDDNRPQVLEIGLKLDGTIFQVGQLIKKIEAENFYKGLTFCRIYNHLNDSRTSDVQYGFKAVLGTIKGS